jgi:Uma2 family endonuclease
MAVLLSELPDSYSGEILPHKTWTRAELEVLESTGLLEGRHFELIEGELIDKMGKKRRHVIATKQVARTLRKAFTEGQIDVEAPIDLAELDNATNEPEPDVIVLRADARLYSFNPGPAELLLVVEVADSTLRQDLGTKARLYARAGIPDYWVVDIPTSKLHVLRDPAPEGYRFAQELVSGDSIRPLANPSASIPVAELLA